MSEAAAMYEAIRQLAEQVKLMGDAQRQGNGGRAPINPATAWDAHAQYRNIAVFTGE